MLQVGCAPVIVSITFPFCSRGKVERRNCSEIAITGDASAASPFVFPRNVSQRKLQSGMRAARNNPAAMEEMARRTWLLRLKVQLLKIFKGQCRSRLIFPFCWIKPCEEHGLKSPPRVCE